MEGTGFSSFLDPNPEVGPVAVTSLPVTEARQGMCVQPIAGREVPIAHSGLGGGGLLGTHGFPKRKLCAQGLSQSQEGGQGWKNRGAVQALSSSRGRPVALRVQACPGLP